MGIRPFSISCPPLACVPGHPKYLDHLQYLRIRAYAYLLYMGDPTDLYLSAALVSSMLFWSMHTPSSGTWKLTFYLYVHAP